MRVQAGTSGEMSPRDPRPDGLWLAACAFAACALHVASRRALETVADTRLHVDRHDHYIRLRDSTELLAFHHPFSLTHFGSL